jgi:hypothetical protein
MLGDTAAADRRTASPTGVRIAALVAGAGVRGMARAVLGAASWDTGAALGTFAVGAVRLALGATGLLTVASTGGALAGGWAAGTLGTVGVAGAVLWTVGFGVGAGRLPVL